MTRASERPTFEWDGTETEFRVGLRFRRRGERPSVGAEGETEIEGVGTERDDGDESEIGIEDAPADGADEEWRLVAVDRSEGMVRFADREWYPGETVAEYVEEGVLSFVEESSGGADGAATITDGATTYLFEPGLKFVADGEFVESNLTGDAAEPVELVVADVADGDVSIAERTEEGYVETNRTMSGSTFERALDLSNVECAGLAPVEERERVVTEE